jgi:hypothetical protein
MWPLWLNILHTSALRECTENARVHVEICGYCITDQIMCEYLTQALTYHASCAGFKSILSSSNVMQIKFRFIIIMDDWKLKQVKILISHYQQQ